MFKIPDWEEDVPASNVKFIKNKSTIKNKKNSKIHETTIQQNGNISHNGLPNLKKNNISNEINSKQSTLVNKYIQHNTSKPQEVPKNNRKSYNKSQKSNLIEQKEAVNENDSKNLDSPKTSKRKSEINIIDTEVDFNESFDSDKLDEAILNAKKKKLYNYNNEEEKDVEEMFSQKSQTLSKKKQAYKNMLQKISYRNEIKVSKNNLRDRMLQRLKAAQFRYINEKLYTSSGSDAKKLFQEDPNAFQTYHEGYQQQVKKWPVNPLNVIVERILKMPKTHLIADMGCGEAVLSGRVSQKVRSFDLVAFNSIVEVCDIAHTPLLASSMDVVVYCLALMGTDLTQYLVEANRVLKMGGHLLIAEVESRFDNVETFVTAVQKIGFTLKNLDKSNQVFYFMEFSKVRIPPKKSKLPYLTLKPCLYKRR